MSLCEIIRLEGYIQSTYLAVYPDKIMLLDGACRPDVPMVLDYIKTTLQRPITDLKVVVVTHMHPDHAGGAHKFRGQTGCLIVSADKDTQWYSRIAGHTMHFVDMNLAHYVARRQGRSPKNLYYPAHLKADITVGEGDCVPGFDEWQVLETPGHTDRDLSLFHLPSRQVYTADLIIKLRHKFVAPFPIYDPKVYIQSLQKIKDLKPSMVMMAHGCELAIDEATFDLLISQAPKHPRTIKDTIKHKLLWRKGDGFRLFKRKHNK
ncbi:MULTISPECIES: MBL fold metallo-hydrolase [unclassified Psychrobacter]|uniref:MBL fold metallo-hydrolase n=1 Tax=unclassified Psychrobacter TaxID=196806 RepID=UPI0025B3253E|nr:MULTISPECIES: MBL fold metallo-hydrolase [unclassified Psychrobacter]MDN3452077.1 MBL fold metallo-hydrolase [Psychrobacter sp. APC 3350]MDN3501377.1 MBL fold metallo-hydrolase [Psychrobacter sp. 5A.1]